MDTTHGLDLARLAAVHRAAGASDTAEAAQMLAAAGVPVFPCAQGSARPLTAGGPRAASTNADRVAWWWSRYPTTNLAVPTGATSRLDVLEVRADRTRSGIGTLQRAVHAGLLPRPGLAISTPTGGLSLLFPRSPQTIQPSWDAPRSGLRFHGDGGHILLPPSLILRADGMVARYQLVGPGSAHARQVDANALRRFLGPVPYRGGRPSLAPTGVQSRFRPDPDGANRRPPEVVSL
jgi:hypothetical protein